MQRRDKETIDILEKAAQETIIDHTLVGSNASTSSFNPHNYRLYFTYGFPVKGLVQGLVKGRFCYERSINHSSEHFFSVKDSSTTFRIKTKLAEVRYRMDDFILINNLKPEEIVQIAERMKLEAIMMFREFVGIFGGKANFEPVAEYYLDNAIKDNSLTEKQRFQDKYETNIVKKLYNEKKLEYKTLTSAKNAAHNAGLYDFSPMIAEKLDDIYACLDQGKQNGEARFFPIANKGFSPADAVESSSPDSTLLEIEARILSKQDLIKEAPNLNTVFNSGHEIDYFECLDRLKRFL